MIVHDAPFNARPRIVILGGGFAGVAVARRLEERLRPGEAEIVLISRENFSVFTPMLPEVTSGALDIRHVVTPVRASCGARVSSSPTSKRSTSTRIPSGFATC